MTPEEHKARHATLFDALDELLADFIRQHVGSTLSGTSARDLYFWAFRQSQEPSEAGPTVHTTAVCAHCGCPVPDAGDHICLPARVAGAKR